MLTERLAQAEAQIVTLRAEVEALRSKAGKDSNHSSRGVRLNCPSASAFQRPPAAVSGLAVALLAGLVLARRHRP